MSEKDLKQIMRMSFMMGNAQSMLSDAQFKLEKLSNEMHDDFQKEDLFAILELMRSANDLFCVFDNEL